MRELVHWAIAHNKLHRMEPVCSYLAATGDLEPLSEYIGALREQFSHQDRWAIFNRDLREATGPCSVTLIERDLLDAEPSTYDTAADDETW